MSHYTDEDMTAGTRAVDQRDECEHETWLRSEYASSVTCDLCDVRAVLDAVAPAIAARALRDFAARMESSGWTHRDDWGVRCAYTFEVTNRADEIANGRI